MRSSLAGSKPLNASASTRSCSNRLMYAEMAAIMSWKAFSRIWIAPLLNETHDWIPAICLARTRSFILDHGRF